ncbi:FBP domain-containing protein [Streptomyces sp. SID10853]|uniref:FBP domain-containing protein n=1 Tax=Streptomyces sp. SID10853 TaxID=2706028 RepID=UPI0013C1D849|nr:FBP domain-containing protein [Streptomyces sp. SID10853]
MRHLSETEIRNSFVNCSKGEAKRVNIPHDLEEVPWDDLDFFGWRDPGAPDRAYLVAEDDGRLLGLVLRAPNGASRGFTSRSMCSLCLTTHTSGRVVLMIARRPGEAGRQGNTIGQYLCADLACSLYVRDKKPTGAGWAFKETLSVDEKVARTRTNVLAFIERVIA